MLSVGRTLIIAGDVSFADLKAAADLLRFPQYSIDADSSPIGVRLRMTASDMRYVIWTCYLHGA